MWAIINNDKFGDQKCHQDKRLRGETIWDYLIHPPNIICIYGTALKILLGCISQTHPDYEELKDTEMKILPLIESIVEGREYSRHQFKLKRLQETIKGLPLVCFFDLKWCWSMFKQRKHPQQQKLKATSRRFLTQGAVVQCHGTQTYNRELFLFTDILIVTEREDENTYHHRHVIDLSKCRLSTTLTGTHHNRQ